MAELSINVEVRTASGKGVARKLRQSGRIPGVFYYAGADSISLSVDKVDLIHLLNAPQALVQLKLSDGKDELAVIKDYTTDPIRDDVTHVDFQGVKRGEEFTVSVPVHIDGEPVGVKLGGTLEQLIYELEISVLPSKLPEFISADVSSLDVGDSVQIKDLIQDDYTILGDEERTLAHVIVTRTYEAELAEMDAAAAAAAEAELEAVGEGEEGVEDAEAPETDETAEEQTGEEETKDSSN